MKKQNKRLLASWTRDSLPRAFRRVFDGLPAVWTRAFVILTHCSVGNQPWLLRSWVSKRGAHAWRGGCCLERFVKCLVYDTPINRCLERLCITVLAKCKIINQACPPVLRLYSTSSRATSSGSPTRSAASKNRELGISNSPPSPG